MSAFLALNGAVLLVIWSELKSLRTSRHAHGNALAWLIPEVEELTGKKYSIPKGV